MKYKIIIFILFELISLIQTCNAENTIENFLSKPTGIYTVGYEDFHWINQNACPDFNYDGKNKNDFTADNKKHCHEIMARIYYPTLEQDKQRSFYQPIKSQKQEILSKMPNIPKEQIQQLSQIKSFTLNKAKVVKNKKFPVLLFSPGLGFPAKIYENIITELVSHGYIVVGINTTFINFAELPNGHIVKTVEIKSPISQEKEHRFVDLPAQDLMYVYNKIHSISNSSFLFSAMDLSHIGLFGHSIGARAIEDVAQTHPALFQALSTLDGDAQVTNKKFVIPFMDMLSSKVKMQEKGEPNSSVELGKNDYLVVLSPNKDETEYSYHLNFTDLSTLQYLPIYQAYKKYLIQHSNDADKKFNIKLMSHEPIAIERNQLIKPTFVLIKKGNKWDIEVYEDKVKKGKLNINKIAGLNKALANLSNKSPEKLSDSEILSVKKILLPLFNRPPKGFLGTGSGWKISSSINSYLLQFFNTYLKSEKISFLKNCVALSKNTYIKCGSNNHNS